MELTETRLTELQMDALFTRDASGRLVTINEPNGGPAPRFFLGRTRGGIAAACGQRWRWSTMAWQPLWPSAPA